MNETENRTVQYIETIKTIKESTNINNLAKGILEKQMLLLEIENTVHSAGLMTMTAFILNNNGGVETLIATLLERQILLKG